MLYPRPTPLNRRPTVPNLPNPHRGHPPAQRVRSSAKDRPLRFHKFPYTNGIFVRRRPMRCVQLSDDRIRPAGEIGNE
jgi:hypothetical protein